jgi:hypothetical protein
MNSSTAVPRVRGDKADVTHVLLMSQGALEILSTIGMVLLMGLNLAYALVPMSHVLLLFVTASAVARRKRWAYWSALLIEMLGLAGYQVNLWLGAVAQVDVTVNLVGLLTSVVLPLLVVIQALRLIREPRAPATAPAPGPEALAPMPMTAPPVWPVRS